MNVPSEMKGEMDAAKSVELVDIEIRTLSDAYYVFPDVAEEAIAYLPFESLRSYPRLTLTNISGAVFVIPTHIIKTISVGGQLRWKAP